MATKIVRELMDIEGFSCGGINSYSGPCGACRDCLLAQHYHWVSEYLNWRRYRVHAREVFQMFMDSGQPFGIYTLAKAYRGGKHFGLRDTGLYATMRRLVDAALNNGAIVRDPLSWHALETFVIKVQE